MLKRRNKKLSKLMARRMSGTHFIVCKVCHEVELEVSADTVAVTCGRCVQLMIPPPENYIKKEKSDKPRGWHFKAYFEHEGVVYSKGIEVTDEDEIKELKATFGKKLPTVKKVSKKKTQKKTRGQKNARTSK